jgi:hypothetical protein
MRTLTIVLTLAASAAPALAQNEYVWITRRASGSGGVTIFDSTGNGVAQLAGAAYGFDQPYGIVSAPVHKLVVVSNSGATPGTVTLLHADTFQPLNVLTIPGSSNLTEMSLSADQNSVFIAGQDVAGPAVFRVDLPSGSSARAGGTVGSGPATGVAVIRASNAGGSGIGPGKVYFSVFSADQVYEINLLTGGTTTLIQYGSGAYPGLSQPRTLARLPDHSAVYATAVTTGPTVMDWVRIDPAQPISAATVVQLDATSMAFGNSVTDATFLNVLGTPRGFALVTRDASPTEIVEINLNGQALGGASYRSVGAAVQGVNLHPGRNTAYMGASSTTDQNFYTSDISGVTPGLLTAVVDVAFNQNGATRFAFVPPPPPPTITDLWPVGLVTGGAPGTATIRVKGSGFQPGTSVFGELGAARTGALPVVFVDSATLDVDVSGFAPGSLYDIVAANPDAQETTVSTIFQALPPASPSPPFVSPLPSSAEGYALRSFPQYHTRAELEAAVTAQLGSYNAAFYRIFFWSSGRYVELDRAGAEDVPDLTGRGFFVLTRFGQSLTLSRPDAGLNTAGGNRVVVLQPGWNIVANPLINGTNRTILYSSVNVTQDPALVSGITSAAGVPALLSTQPWEYVDRAYRRSDRMTAGQAYWIYNLSSGPLFLIINAAQVNLAGEIPATSTPSKSASSTEPPPPAPPSESESAGGDSGSPGCGLLGAEILLLAVALRRRPRA